MSEGRYRCSARRFFLTFPRFDGGAQSCIVEILLKWEGCVKGLAVQELHQDGGPHVHVILIFDQVKDFRDAHWADFIAGKHGNYKPVKNLRASCIYCQKEAKPDCFGGFDIEAILAKKSLSTIERNLHILEVGPDSALESGHLSLYQYRAALQGYNEHKLHAAAASPLDSCRGHWYYGKSGAGKTREAVSGNPGCFRKDPDKWWDGYSGQDIVVLDDLRFDDAKCMVRPFTQWTDHYSPGRGQTKGGSVALVFSKFIVTSQWSIDELYRDGRDLEALKRRFTEREFKL